MRTKFSGILTLLLAFVVQLTFAQEKTISGTISDNSGLPLPGVNIIVKGTSNGTQSDFDGNYSIQANIGQTLVYSYVGFNTSERKVTTSNSISLQMQENFAELDEIIVTAIGLKKKKDDDLSSATLIPVEAITRANESGLIQGLAGKTSGVNITRSSGDPGAGAYIQIRGANTILGSDEPLVVVDGVLIDNRNFQSGVDGVSESSRLNDIPAEDIENVTILKGASATSIYGTGAANGVIVITTKTGRGDGDKKWRLSYKTSISVDEVNEEWALQSKYGQGLNGVFLDSGNFNRNTWGDKISNRPGGADEVTVGNERFEALSGNIYYPIDTKNSRETYLKSNRDAVLGTGYAYENSLSLQYSGDDSNTFISGNTWKQDGVIKSNSTYYRRSLRFNNTTKYADNLTGKISSSYIKTTGDQIQFGSNINGLYLGYLRTSPDFDVRDYKGTYFDSNNNPTIDSHRAYRDPLGKGNPGYNNPLWTLNEQTDTQQVERLLLTPELTYDFTDNISLTARYSIDSYRDRRESFIPINSSTNIGAGNGYFSIDERNVNSQYFTAFLNSLHEVSDSFNFSWVLGMTYEEDSLEQLGGVLDGFNVVNISLDDLIDISNGTSATNDAFDFYNYKRQMGGYLLVDGELFNQVLFQVSGRLDRSSTLNNQNFFYPAASLGWKFSELIGDNNFLSFGKLRVSYGEVAVAPLAYSLSSGFAVGGGVGSSWGDSLAGAQYGSLGSRVDGQGNPNVDVERAKEYEYGMDLRLLDRRVSIGFTYYDKEIEGVLLNRPVSAASGFSSLVSNAANISNKGIEFDVAATILRSDNFKWALSFNYSQNKNLVTGPDGTGELLSFLNGFTGTSANVYDGQPFSVLVGDPFLRDESGEKVLNEFGFPTKDTAGQQIIGDPNPDWRGGIGTRMEYKGFRISAQFDIVQGNDVWNGTQGVLNHFGVSPETATEVTISAADAATIVNFAGTPVQDLAYAHQNADGSYTVRGSLTDFGAGTVLLDQIWYNSNSGPASGFNGTSELYIQDGSYVKLRELTFGYAVPKTITKRLGLSSLDLSIAGRNLVTWTNVEGFDPDNNLTGASKGRGLEYFTNPSTSSYTFTLRLGL